MEFTLHSVVIGGMVIYFIAYGILDITGLFLNKGIWRRPLRGIFIILGTLAVYIEVAYLVYLLVMLGFTRS